MQQKEKIRDTILGELFWGNFQGKCPQRNIWGNVQNFMQDYTSLPVAVMIVTVVMVNTQTHRQTYILLAQPSELKL